MSQLPKKVSKVTPNKRILNEIAAKALNEANSDKVTQARKGTDRGDMVFGCECDTKDCPETISISTQEYANVHQKNMHFIVVPSHVRPDIEEIVTSFANYCVVKKLSRQPEE